VLHLLHRLQDLGTPCDQVAGLLPAGFKASRIRCCDGTVRYYYPRAAA